MTSFLAIIFTFVASPVPLKQADHLVISKSRHTLTLLANDKTLHVYSVSLGRLAGPKQRAGDHRTPEGHYVIDGRNANSKFHLALHVSYPNAGDRAGAAARHEKPGGDIEIHGLPAAFSGLGRMQRIVDWTNGCIAVTNAEMDEIFRLVPNGTPVDIEP
jgi:murein L,D-transpeptidase YafK